MWLKLELEALKAALRVSAGSSAQAAHLRHALLFRQYRRSKYPSAAASENALELNEGLAEYTGLVATRRTPLASITHLISAIDTFYRNPSFVRSFAYCTVPAYGYLLQRSHPAWHRTVRRTTDLTALFAQAFSYAEPPKTGMPTEANRRARTYGARAILAAEARREEERQRRVAAFRHQFIESPPLVIPLLKMNISFDPRDMQPLGEAGTVYPQLKVADSWGTLTVTAGALLGTNWDKVTLPAPSAIAGERITGEGYVLLLNPGWSVQKDASGHGFTVSRRP